MKLKIFIKSEWVESHVDKFVENRRGELEEHEKFQDDTGNVYEVEARRVRE